MILWIGSVGYAETETTADVTENSAGATTSCGTRCTNYNFDPRSDINSDGGDDDDIVYWDNHGALYPHYNYGINTEWTITNDVDTFLTEEQMLAGFTMDAAVGLRDRGNYQGGDPFTIQIKVTDGTTTYSDLSSFTTSAGTAYETVTSQLIVPENTLNYASATFGLILDGASLSYGYGGPQTNLINLTATYELPALDIVNDVITYVADVVDTTVADILESSTNTATMEIDVTSPTGTTSMTVGVSVGGAGGGVSGVSGVGGVNGVGGAVGGPGTIIMSVPTPSGGVQTMTIDTGMSSSASGTSATVEAVAEVASAVVEVETAMSELTSETTSEVASEVTSEVAEVAEVESKMESKSESKSESSESKSESKQEVNESKADKAKVVQAIVSRILQSIEVSGGDVNDTKIALMSITTAAADFSSYQTASIPDVAFYDTTVSYESHQMPDPLGGIYNLGSDQMMEEMIMSQYK